MVRMSDIIDDRGRPRWRGGDLQRGVWARGSGLDKHCTRYLDLR